MLKLFTSNTAHIARATFCVVWTILLVPVRIGNVFVELVFLYSPPGPEFG